VADFWPRSPILSPSSESSSALSEPPSGSAPDTASEIRPAACRPRHPSDGLPSVSADAMINPPSRLKSVRKLRRLSALRCGSDSFQNRCPPRLPGITVNARVAEAIRGILPVASNRPPPIWTAALMRAAVSGSAGTFVPTGSGSVRNAATVGCAASAPVCGFRSVSTPWPMKAADNRGRAIRRSNMAGVFPD
jgi:hypothetical protein